MQEGSGLKRQGSHRGPPPQASSDQSGVRDKKTRPSLSPLPGEPRTPRFLPPPRTAPVPVPAALEDEVPLPWAVLPSI